MARKLHKVFKQAIYWLMFCLALGEVFAKPNQLENIPLDDQDLPKLYFSTKGNLASGVSVANIELVLGIEDLITLEETIIDKLSGMRQKSESGGKVHNVILQSLERNFEKAQKKVTTVKKLFKVEPKNPSARNKRFAVATAAIGIAGIAQLMFTAVNRVDIERLKGLTHALTVKVVQLEAKNIAALNNTKVLEDAIRLLQEESRASEVMGVQNQDAHLDIELLFMMASNYEAIINQVLSDKKIHVSIGELIDLDKEFESLKLKVENKGYHLLAQNPQDLFEGQCTYIIENGKLEITWHQIVLAEAKDDAMFPLFELKTHPIPLPHSKGFLHINDETQGQLYAHDKSTGDFILIHKDERSGCHQQGQDYFCVDKNIIQTNSSAGISCPSALFSKNPVLVKQNCEMHLVRMQIPMMYQMSKSEYVIISEHQHEVTLVCSEPDPKTGLAIPKTHIKRFERYSKYTHKPNCELIGKYFKIPRMTNVDDQALQANLTLPFNRESLLDIFPENLVNKTLDKMLIQGTPKFKTWLAQFQDKVEDSLSSYSVADICGIGSAIFFGILTLFCFFKKFCGHNSNGGTGGGGQITNINLMRE